MAPNGHPQLPFHQSHAFIIGINDYQHISPLKTAVADAKGIASRLEAQHGYAVHPPLLNPNKAELTQLFEEIMPQTVGKEDRVVVYFAGHGIALDGEEGPNGYIVPADAKQGDKESLVPMDSLHQTLNELPCQHGLLILDCCFSGAFKWSTGYRDLVFDLPKVIYEERFWRYVKDPAWQVITSSAYDQKAVDVISNQSIGMREEGQGKHSPFAHALFEALDGAADVVPADQGDGVITASELYAYLRDSVETQTTEHVKRQSPSMFNLGRHDKGEFIFLNPRHRFNLPPTPDRNPFMGLASYNEADSHFFFGRDRVTEALYEKVQNHALTVVSGASGTGKSSVIKAGLLPKLRKEGWEQLAVIRPGKEPMEVLADEIGDISTRLNSDGYSLLIIDQYEELITQTLHEEDRTAFEQQLADWISAYPKLRIILSVRSDFEPQFESHELAPWWQAGRYIVPGFSGEEIREVITQPALQAVLFYEPIELADKLEEDVAQAPGALPLLSFTLSELYYAYLKSGRQDRALTLEDYEALGGVIGALRTKADETYTSQEEAHQNSLRHLMLRMVSLEGGELAGKRVYVEELEYSDESETARIQQVAKELVDARLILRGKDLHGRIYLEPAHDALVRAWARLWEWIKAIGEEKLIWQNKLSQAVGDYHELQETNPSKAKHLLWNNNPRLDILKAELQESNHMLNAQEENFVRMSVKRRTARQRQLIGSLLAALVIFAGLAFWANGQRIEANNSAELAERRSDTARWAQEDAEEAKQAALDSAAVAQRQRVQADSTADVVLLTLTNLRTANENIVRSMLKEVRELSKVHRYDEALGKWRDAASLRVLSAEIAQGKREIVRSMLQEPQQDIRKLQYTEASEKYTNIAKFGELHQEVIKGWMEVAFFYGESKNIEIAKQLLVTASKLMNKPSTETTSRLAIRKTLQQLNPDWYQELKARYYPRMIMVNDTASIARTETTIWQYHLYCEATGLDSMSRIMPDVSWGLEGDNPITYVSFYDAARYANWMSKQEGLDTVYVFSAPEELDATHQEAKGYRLPHGDLWKEAAKGGQDFEYSGRRTRPVATKRANALGLHDMSGNVEEWCEDLYTRYSPEFQRGRLVYPRMVLGGSWNALAGESRVAWRTNMKPSSRYHSIGFRLAKSY